MKNIFVELTKQYYPKKLESIFHGIIYREFFSCNFPELYKYLVDQKQYLSKQSFLESNRLSSQMNKNLIDCLFDEPYNPDNLVNDIKYFEDPINFETRTLQQNVQFLYNYLDLNEIDNLFCNSLMITKIFYDNQIFLFDSIHFNPIINIKYKDEISDKLIIDFFDKKLYKIKSVDVSKTEEVINIIHKAINSHYFDDQII